MGGAYSRVKWIDADPFKKDVRQYRDEVFSPVLHRREKYTVLAIGKQSAGKSSLISGILTNSGDQDHVRRCASVGVDDYSFSINVKRYPVSQTVDIIDTPGYNDRGRLDSDNDVGFTLEMITDIMDGRVKDDAAMSAKSVEQRNPAKTVDAVVLILDITAERTVQNQLIRFYKDIIHRCKERRISFCVALTKVDELCDRLDWVFYHTEVGNKVKEIAEMLGILSTFVLPVQNYTNQRDRVKNIDLLTLDCMKIVLRDTVDMAEHRQ